MQILLLVLACVLQSLQAIEKYPVDICYMVADLKYNAKQGVKICEVQQASLSLFNGDKFRSLEEESIHKELLRALSLYNQSGWVVADSIADKNLVSTLSNSRSWKSPKDMIALFSDPQFMKQAKQPAHNIYDLQSYQGYLYINWNELSTIYDFEKIFPGIVVLDKSSFPFWVDKYLMTKLFSEDPLLSKVKPRWGNYKKIYSDKLAEQIAGDLKCETFVIKPRGEFLGKGVIIANRQELDEVLLYIIHKKGKLAESNDPAYTAWKKDPFDSFIVEEFVSSDPITIPHLENKTYQPTMRVAFLLVYNKHHHDVHFLGGYWKTPEISLNDEGSFMEKNKDICEPPYYYAVDPKIMQAVQSKLGETLLILHRKMLKFDPNQQEPCYALAHKRKLQIVLQKTTTSSN